MSELHPLYKYGPLGFVIASAFLSSALAPRVVRVADRMRRQAADLRLSRFGRPKRSVEGVRDGEKASFIGELASPSAKRYELCLEHAEDTDETMRLVPKLEILVEGRPIELDEHVAIDGGSKEAVSGASRWRRLSIGDRVHATGVVALGDVENGTFRTNARAVRLVGDPMAPVRIVYAGTPAWRRPSVVKAVSTLVAAVAIWCVASLVGLLLIALPVRETPGRLPGDHVDATLVAHVVPPVSQRAARTMALRLETGGDAKRYTPPGAREERLAQAAQLDATPEETFSRWIRLGYRTRAGKVALGNPSGVTCGPGLLAFAEAARVGGVAQLLLSCSAFASDDAADAAFSIGNFSESRGAEAETIVFRQALAPINGVPCVAGGDKVPPPDQPLCALIHAEMKPKLRRDILKSLTKLDPFGERWVFALHALDGSSLPDSARWTIPPSDFVVRPVASLLDQPLAVYAELWQKKASVLGAADALWVAMAVAAERSTFGHHESAVGLAQEALDRAANEAPAADLVEATRLALAIAIRAGDRSRAEEWEEGADLAGDDDLADQLAFARDPLRVAPPISSEMSPEVLRFDDGAELAEDLTERGGGPSSQARMFLRVGLPLALRSVPLGQRPPLREWLREGFPAFRQVRFFPRVEALTERLDAAHSLGDGEMVSDLEPIVARFEAVLLNRTLGLSLRAATQWPESPR